MDFINSRPSERDHRRDSLVHRDITGELEPIRLVTLTAETFCIAREMELFTTFQIMNPADGFPAESLKLRGLFLANKSKEASTCRREAAALTVRCLPRAQS